MPILSTKRVALLAITLTVLGIIVYKSTYKKTEIPLVTAPIIEEIVAVRPAKEILGKSAEGRNIEAYNFGTGKTHIVFVGGIHGGYEWNSVLLAYAFIDYLSTHPEIVPKNLTIEVIPSANPDGVYRVTKKEGRFSKEDVSLDEEVLASGRFNGNNVDLNRNFDCKWKSTSMWRKRVVSGGTSSFSEPEAKVIRNFMLTHRPAAAIFWHSKSNAVYASKCDGAILSETLSIMNLYSIASGYQAVKTFDAYETTGAADDWLASINIPAITVELSTHEEVEWEKNLKGVKAILEHYRK